MNDGDPDTGEKIRLNARLRLAAYAGHFFAYDIADDTAPMLAIRTEEIEEALYHSIRRLKADGIFIEPIPKSALQELLTEQERESGFLETCIAKSYLLPFSPPIEQVKNRFLSNLSAKFIGRAEPDTEAEKTHFAPNRFFNLPEPVDAAAAQVGLMGLPYASVPVSTGTQLAPDMLRLLSRSVSWLSLHETGAYFDLLTDGGRPEVLCKGVVLKDCGNLDCVGNTPEELFVKLRSTLDDLFLSNAMKPLFIGGDHALTYPIVRALLAETPNMGLIHLDAHNDLFYVDDISFNHAAMLSNILKATGIEKIASFGLRSSLDQRVGNVTNIFAQDRLVDRISLTSITALKQLLVEKDGLARVMRSLAGRPYYLSLDLDVMSESAINGQTSTPCGSGLEWREVHQVLAEVFVHLEIVGADLVEYNPANGSGGIDQHEINALILRIVDGLARGSDAKVFVVR